MTLERSTSGVAEAWAAREFDYGVGDDVRSTEERIRSEIAARIREVGQLDAGAARHDQRLRAGHEWRDAHDHARNEDHR